MTIVDSDVLSALMRDAPDAAVTNWLDRQSPTAVWTTAVTLLEIRFGIALLPVGRQRSRLEREIEAILSNIIEDHVVPFDTAAAEETAALMAERQKRGRRIELRDAMIAGIAIAHRATLATRNTRHFNDLPVPVVDPWES